MLLPAQRAFSRTLTGRGFREEARLVLAHFRNDAGLIGAADLARHAMVEPPDSAHFGFWPRRRKTSRAANVPARPRPTPKRSVVGSHALARVDGARRSASLRAWKSTGRERHRSEHGAVAGVGGRWRGSWVIRMPKPARKLPTASQPAQVGNRRPKVVARTSSTAYPMPIQPSSTGSPGRGIGGSGSGVYGG